MEKNPHKRESSSLAIVGGDVVTVTRGTIRGGTVLIEDGKIVAVGNQVEIPAETPQIDATGRVVTPGFIALDMSRVGLRTSSEQNARYVDGLDPFDDNVKLSLSVGITAGCVEIQAPGAASVVAAMNCNSQRGRAVVRVTSISNQLWLVTPATVFRRLDRDFQAWILTWRN